MRWRPPVIHNDSLFPAVICIGFQGLAQHGMEPVVDTEVIDAVVQVILGVDGSVAALEGPRALAEQPAQSLHLVLLRLILWALLAVADAAVETVAALIEHLPALAQIHGVLSCIPVGQENIVLGVAIAVATHPAHFVGQHTGDLHHQVVIPVVQDLQQEAGFNQDGPALLLQLELPLGEGDGEAGVVVVHLEGK